MTRRPLNGQQSLFGPPARYPGCPNAAAFRYESEKELANATTCPATPDGLPCIGPACRAWRVELRYDNHGRPLRMACRCAWPGDPTAEPLPFDQSLPMGYVTWAKPSTETVEARAPERGRG